MPCSSITKRLTKPGQRSAKTPDQKSTTPLQATDSKAYSQLLPRYSQPVPQQTGTSQNRDKTAICSGFMSRFERSSILFSTISLYLKPQPRVGAAEGCDLLILLLICGKDRSLRQLLRFFAGIKKRPDVEFIRAFSGLFVFSGRRGRRYAPHRSPAAPCRCR